MQKAKISGSLAAALIYILAAAGLSLLNTQQASAYYIDPQYRVYSKGSAIISNKSPVPSTPLWIRDTFIPQITTAGVGCDDNKVGTRDFNSSVKFWNCSGLKINADTATQANIDWFKDANISYRISDFDNAETIDIGRGRIVAYGASVKSVAPDRQSAKAKKNTGSGDTPNCDSTNPNKSDDCSLVIYFAKGDPGDFHITLSNVFDSGKPSSGHEYWYDGPVVYPYYTLILNPNASDASVDETNPNGDSVRLVSRKSGSNLLRDYASDPKARSSDYPDAERAGYIFDGWYDSPIDGKGVQRTSWWITKDKMTLYAHWKSIAGGYELVPHVNAPVDAVKQGDTVTFTPSVTKDNSNDSNPTTWKFCRVVTAPGIATPAAGSVCSDPTATIVESQDNYVFSGGGPFAIGDPINYTYMVPAGTLYGSQICYALLVDSSTQDSGHPAESVKCVIVAKSPRVQVWGNDTRVGSSFFGLGSNNESLIGANKGSWGEYGVIAPGTITGFGSGSVAGGTLLTFANKPTPGGFTQATSITGLGAIPNVRAYLEKAGSATYRAKTGINLVSALGTIGAYAANTVYTSDGTVTIDGDIINPSKGNNLSQMVIIADNINILPNVKQVDAWLIATNAINTCWLNGDVPKIGNCGDDTNASTLHINGPVMAKSLLLNRTGGLDTDDSSAAEVINLRGDAYIWMHKLSAETGSIRTVYARELAPRY